MQMIFRSLGKEDGVDKTDRYRRPQITKLHPVIELTGVQTRPIVEEPMRKQRRSSHLHFYIILAALFIASLDVDNRELVLGSFFVIVRVENLQRGNALA